jgi:mannose-6-phosphate isomerase-like protein (cupin superfamily)
MASIISTSDVTPKENEKRKLWRLLNPETLGADPGAVAGVIAYKYRDAEPADAELGEAHGRAEFYYVMSGEGVIGEDGGGRSAVRPGDSFVIHGGSRHSIWSTSPDEPLLTFYVSLRD